ncbi:hypothetical protein DET49_12371 [Salegentibacter sp. 24]|uniref:hypothetical protein n=1 Tax=Salegentibacter sp. 24 TaxID=2183986 RepID=UPI00105C1AF2|nr:hypothetical protein [Salegentibacter sp. 24]TDN82804.1 hypothetical protein DET49_12371 [Salegentibacter sp. 24]
MNFFMRCLVFIALVISPSVNAQELQGKWIVSGNKSFGAFPGIHVMQVSDDSLSHYNFDQFLTKTSYNLEDDQLKIDSLAFAHYSFINPNRLSISSERLEKPIDYIRLVPTETDLNAEEIKQIRYQLKRGGETFAVDFQNRSQGKITHSYLKKIDQTYFLVIYRHGKPVTAVPIEKITKDSLTPKIHEI